LWQYHSEKIEFISATPNVVIAHVKLFSKKKADYVCKFFSGNPEHRAQSNFHPFSCLLNLRKHISEQRAQSNFHHFSCLLNLRKHISEHRAQSNLPHFSCLPKHSPFSARSGHFYIISLFFLGDYSIYLVVVNDRPTVAMQAEKPFSKKKT
jgi:hypothetical protein